MGNSLRMRYSLVLASLLIGGVVHADVSCQDGITYENSCNPYQVHFIQLNNNRVSEQATAVAKETSVTHKKEWFSKNYFNSILDRYSRNYDGRSGLQALIDRNHYTKSKESQKIVSNEQNATLSRSNQISVVDVTTQEKTQEVQENTIATQIGNKQPKSVVKKEENSTSRTHVAQQISVVKYKIQQGDSLSVIASVLGVSVKELKVLNNLKDEGTIKFGQSLKIPAHLAKKINAYQKLRAQKTKEIIAQQKELKNLREQLKHGIYIVQKGDSLTNIAKKTNLSLNQLREYNHIARSSNIFIGQKLSIKRPKVKKIQKSFNYVKNIKFTKATALKFKRKIRVVATAYTSHRNQTDKTPFLAAWNNRIHPGMKIIAVSEDLIRKYGLTNGVKVKITGLPGYYVVRDKMNKRLRNHIDIYMGLNKRKALHWGRRRVALYW